MAFIKLFPLGMRDNDKYSAKKVDTNQSVAHLMKYAEIDSTLTSSEENPHANLYYPFAEHERFSF